MDFCSIILPARGTKLRHLTSSSLENVAQVPPTLFKPSRVFSGKPAAATSARRGRSVITLPAVADSERRTWRAGGVSGAAIRAERRPLRKRGRPAPRPGIARWSATPYLGAGRPPRADHIPAALVGRDGPAPGMEWTEKRSGCFKAR